MIPLTSFFTPISYRETSPSASEHFLEIIDDYFYLGGKRAVVIPDQTTGHARGVFFEEGKSSLINTAFKIASYGTLILPAIALLAKLILRSTHTFYVVELKEETTSDFSSQQEVKKAVDPDILPGALSGRIARQRLRNEKAASVLQRAYRGHVARRKFKEKKSAAITLQSAFRGRGDRIKVGALRVELPVIMEAKNQYLRQKSDFINAQAVLGDSEKLAKITAVYINVLLFVEGSKPEVKARAREKLEQVASQAAKQVDKTTVGFLAGAGAELAAQAVGSYIPDFITKTLLKPVFSSALSLGQNERAVAVGSTLASTSAADTLIERQAYSKAAKNVMKRTQSLEEEIQNCIREAYPDPSPVFRPDSNFVNRHFNETLARAQQRRIKVAAIDPESFFNEIKSRLGADLPELKAVKEGLDTADLTVRYVTFVGDMASLALRP